MGNTDKSYKRKRDLHKKQRDGRHKKVKVCLEEDREDDVVTLREDDAGIVAAEDSSDDTAAPRESSELDERCAEDVDETPAKTLTPEEEEERRKKRKVVVVLEKAALETVKTKKGFELLHADEHKHILLKHKRDPSQYRADIVHQTLLALLDSPLNKAGHLQVYIHTDKVTIHCHLHHHLHRVRHH